MITDGSGGPKRPVAPGPPPSQNGGMLPKRVRLAFYAAMLVVTLVNLWLSRAGASAEVLARARYAALALCLALTAAILASPIAAWWAGSRRPKDGPEADYHDRVPFDNQPPR
jgi:hypothetical protein